MVRSITLLIQLSFRGESFGLMEHTVTLDNQEPLVLKRNDVKVSDIEREPFSGSDRSQSSAQAGGLDGYYDPRKRCKRRWRVELVPTPTRSRQSIR